MNTYILNKRLSFLPVIFLVFGMAVISGYLLYQIFPNKNTLNSFIPVKTNEKTVYILKSKDTEIYLNTLNQSADVYDGKIAELAKKLKSVNINAKIISQSDILTLPENAILFAPDMYKATKNTMKKIESFIKKGGTFIFNYHFGYFTNGDYLTGPKRIETITGLKFLSESVSKEHINFYIPNIMSPLIKTDINAKRHDLVLYGSDTLPIFKSDFTPDMIITNWEVTSPPMLNGKFLSVNEDGIAWHGFYGKGKWFYFSLPLYVFLDMPKNLFGKYMNNLTEYAKNDFVIAKYPYIDADKAVFISEDTEYKYENMINFARLAKKEHINVTLFCVAKLALQHPAITKEAASFPNVEIGSHSFSHTKILGAPLSKVIKEIEGSKEILQKITGKPVYGFRPPREEIDKIMENELRKAGYKYVMEKTKPFLLPKEVYDNLITIPRHGTDDYIYVINLDWNKSKILKKIIQETEMLTKMHALYTLSVHTHLLSYKTNLSVSEKYFEYLNKHTDIKAFKGIELNNRARELPNITFKKEYYGNNILLSIYNKNNKTVKNFSFRIFWPNIKIKAILPVDVSTKIKKIKNSTKRHYTDYRINKLSPNSSTSVIIKYEKIN